MKQQTAIQWLIEQLLNLNPTQIEWHEAVEKAKQMEKQQIMDAYNQGYREGELDDEKFEGDISEFTDALLYYKNTYTDETT